ncbi:MAG TPA: DUF6384 family protein [Lacipirellulaceae bacterium]|nr:DUF6384 family protein [Lacipirellulaceae bacterium]
MAESQTVQYQRTSQEGLQLEGQSGGDRLSLKEMSRILDVAGALRKERALVEQQLNIDQIKQALRERLLAAAQLAGDQVTAAEVDAAIEQYYDRLHDFREPPASFAMFFAHLWVRRRLLVNVLAAVAAVVGILWSLLATGVLPGEARNEKQLAARERAVTERFAAVESAIAAATELAAEPEVQDELSVLSSSMRAARRQSDVESLKRIEYKVAALIEELKMDYSLTIVSRPGTDTGRERVWTDERGSRASGLYVLVEARDAQHEPVLVTIEDRETGRTSRVSKWAEQMPADVFARLEADKAQDGILDERQFGRKRRGRRHVEVTIPGVDGAPITRQGQIAGW